MSLKFQINWSSHVRDHRERSTRFETPLEPHTRACSSDNQCLVLLLARVAIYRFFSADLESSGEWRATIEPWQSLQFRELGHPERLQKAFFSFCVAIQQYCALLVQRDPLLRPMHVRLTHLEGKFFGKVASGPHCIEYLMRRELMDRFLCSLLYRRTAGCVKWNTS